MEVTGKLIQIMPVQTGQGKNGEWKKQEFVIETGDKYPKKIALTVFGEKIDLIGIRQPGDVLTVKFDIESREYQGRWFSNINAYSISGSQHGSTNPPASSTPIDPLASEPGVLEDDSPSPADTSRPNRNSTDGTDDLPF